MTLEGRSFLCLTEVARALGAPVRRSVPFREWLTAPHIEVLGSMGGSLYSDNIVDYYMDPIEDVRYQRRARLD
jgi:hypothetical protein